MKLEPGQPKTMGLAAFFAGAVTLVPTLWLILSGHNAGRAAFDSIVYHERFIRDLAASWPRFDVSNPLTATTPGYHVLLATFMKLGFDSELALRLISALIGASLGGLLAAWLAKRSSKYDAVLMILPLACSSYVVQSGAWLLPDNLAWLGVAAIMMLTLHPSVSWRPVILGSVVLLGLVMVRQIHIWAAGLVWLTAWLNARPTERSVFDELPARSWHAGVAVLMTLPAFLVLAWFLNLWGGLTAPRFQTDITGIGVSTPAFLLVQLAVFSVGFSPWLLPPIMRAAKRSPRPLLIAAGIGFLLAVIPSTTYNEEAGRFSGFWGLAKLTPVIAGHSSPAFLVLAPIGAAVFAGSLIEIPRRKAWVFMGAFIAFTAAQSNTINSWQRYHEPMLLMMLALMSSVQPVTGRPAATKYLRPVAITALCVLLLAVMLHGVRGEPVVRGTVPPPMHTSPDDPWYEPVDADVQPPINEPPISEPG